MAISPGALKSTTEYDNARANVLYYDVAKGKYALELIHPQFARKQFLCKEEALDFIYALLPENLSFAKSQLAQQAVAFQHCQDFKGARVQSSTVQSLGKALVATKAFASNDLVLIDKPFLVVSNPEGLGRWVNRFDCSYDVIKRAAAGNRDILDAFEAMDPGGQQVVESLEPDAESTLELLWSLAGTGTSPPENLRAPEVKRVATIFARWQTNQHEFPSIRATQRRALYWIAPKVAHSCDPNVGWEDPSEQGVVELRALQNIQVGEVLGVNYMDQGFLSGSVSERRKRLKAERKFECLCSRCMMELASNCYQTSVASQRPSADVPSKSAPSNSNASATQSLITLVDEEAADEKLQNSASTGVKLKEDNPCDAAPEAQPSNEKQTPGWGKDPAATKVALETALKLLSAVGALSMSQDDKIHAALEALRTAGFCQTLPETASFSNLCSELQQMLQEAGADIDASEGSLVHAEEDLTCMD